MAAHVSVETAIHEVLNSNIRPAVAVVSPAPKTLEKTETSRPGLFADALLEKRHLAKQSKPAELLVALSLHVVLIAGPILAGLYFTDTADLRAFTTTLLVAPPPPPPPAPAMAGIKVHGAKRVFVQQGKLLAPTYIPKEVAQIKEAPLESEFLDGVSGGVPGGVPGGQLGGVIGGIVGSVAHTNLPAPAATVSNKAPLRVGGRVRFPRILVKTAPVYPTVARATKTQGVIQIDAIIDTQGNVIEMRAVSGPPILIPAALSAVRNWKFEPTYLNDQAVPVELVVTVNFQLNE